MEIYFKLIEEENQEELYKFYLADNFNKSIFNRKINNEIFKKIKILAKNKKGNRYARYYIGCSYIKTPGIIQNFEKAFKYFKLSADQNDRFAQHTVGYFYHYGYGVKYNYEEAIKYYELSANQDNSGAKYDMGYMYKNTKDININIKYKIEDHIKEQIKNDKNIDKYELDENTIKMLKYEIENEKLKKEISDLKIHIESSPDGKTYFEAKAHYEMINKK